jgi:hypothetical protein
MGNRLVLPTAFDFSRIDTQAENVSWSDPDAESVVTF